MVSQARRTLAPVVALFFGIAILLVGNGLQGTLLAVRGTLENLTTNELGVIQSSYFLGFVAGSLICTRMIERAGHIRTFAALASIASAAALAHLLIIDPLAWSVFRAVTGFCFAGLYMAIESWLNATTANKVRGEVFSVYMAVNLLALSLGQLLFTTADPGGYVLFCLVSVIISLALVPVAMTRSIAPVITRIERAPLRKLYEVSPLGVFGCAVYGLAMSAFWALAPVFFQKTGLGSDRIGYIMSVTILGGFLVQWPVGWVSDRVDRRSVITVMATLAALVAFALPFFAGVWTGLLILSLLFGAASFPIYSLTVAHVNDFIDRGEALAVSSSLLLVYGAGAIAGPIIGGILMDWIGAGGLYYYIAFMFAGIGAFAVFRMARSGPSPEETHEAFTPTLATTPQVLGLDPRSEPEIEPLAEAERSTG